MARPSVEVERRQQILQATCESIATLGFRGVRVADVAKGAGVSSGTVHYYFESKDALLHAAFAFNFENSLRRRDWILDAKESPRAHLHHLVSSYLPSGPETITAWRVWVELWAAALGSAELQALNDSVYETWRNLVRGTVDAAREEGTLNVDNDEGDLTDMLLGMLDGLAIQALVGSSHVTRERMLEVCDAFIDSIMVPNAELVENANRNM
ncbi:TetR/AcrR family transcriptional regulator [Rhodococcus sp. IEGM 1366]|uniref:TetR/AcrR family transcriptional regulator n=1 Tax=Rhodococcus sp. IEGM 1366 TaxID=3082223 RepID=UPI002953163A|nr:TetR/AcrR family transcriptional regulator [Rhodococcus sp. IEGM 1366]MDV8070712.1 TetR/AcrR family transcriptional regulator [Rhodococcus sp. IEGM 1366]